VEDELSESCAIDCEIGLGLPLLHVRDTSHFAELCSIKVDTCMTYIAAYFQREAHVVLDVPPYAVERCQAMSEQDSP